MRSSEFFTELETFQARVRPLIEVDPVGATMFGSVLVGQLLAPEPGIPPLMVVIVEQGTVAAAAMRITEHPLIVLLDPGNADPAGVLADLTAVVAASGQPVTGLTGRRPTVVALAEQWSAITGITPEPRMALRYHRLGTLIPPTGVSGVARMADVKDPADLDLLASWWFAFEHETGANAHPPAAPDPEVLLRAAGRGQVICLWCYEDRPLAAAGHTAVRDNASRIAPVYTPPELRRHGYGSAATAAAVRSAQQQGARHITLFTDADYLPANEVYRRLGFRAVADFADYEIPSADPS